MQCSRRNGPSRIPPSRNGAQGSRARRWFHLFAALPALLRFGSWPLHLHQRDPTWRRSRSDRRIPGTHEPASQPRKPTRACGCGRLPGLDGMEQGSRLTVHAGTNLAAQPVHSALRTSVRGRPAPAARAFGLRLPGDRLFGGPVRGAMGHKQIPLSDYSRFPAAGPA